MNDLGIVATLLAAANGIFLWPALFFSDRWPDRLGGNPLFLVGPMLVIVIAAGTIVANLAETT